MTTGIIDKKRLIFPGLAGLYETFSPASYSFMRFATGVVLLPHGIQKIMLGSAVNLAPFIDKQTGLPNPLMWAYFAIFAESVCALCLDRAFHSPRGIDHPDRDGGHRFLFPMAVRLFLDRQGL